MYLYRFGMKKLPFGLTPDTEFFCATPTHREALNLLHFALESGEALIKIVGEVGSGKTLLCRLLLNQLEQSRPTAYMPYPKLSADELKLALARELGIRISDPCRTDQLATKIQNRLLKLNREKGPVVLLIDEAQLLDDDGFETLRLFTNLETEQKKLLQIVIFGQPELDRKLARPSLRQIRQRIVFSYHLLPLSRRESQHYVEQRLAQVTDKKIHYPALSNWLIDHYAGGIPRLINVLCHKSLLLAFAQNRNCISPVNIIRAARDTDAIATPLQKNFTLTLTLLMLLLSGSAMAFWGLA